MQRIVVLMSDTGGGHRASAQALEAAFTTRYAGQFQIEIVDLWSDYTSWPINQLPRLYSPMIAHTPWLWKWLWDVSENHRLISVLNRLVYRTCRSDLQKMLQNYRPHLIISVHPLMQDIPLYLLQQEGVHIPFVTVVTDLVSVNRNWFHPRADRCFVASTAAADAACRYGLAPHQVRLLGLPILPAFATPVAAERPDQSRYRPQSFQQATVRERLGLPKAGLTALLVGGGEGMGPVAAIARCVATQLAASETDGQLVVICGHNERLRRELQRTHWPIHVQVHGFVDNMPEWMAAVDCIITKAGPGTIAEALSSGLPILLSGFIPGQEEGNVPFVVDNGVGAYCESPVGIAKIVSSWFGPEREKLREMAARARALGRPQATYDIVDEIVELLGSYICGQSRSDP